MKCLRLRFISATFAASALFTLPCMALDSGEAGFGWQWVRSNPMTFMADGNNPTTWDIDEYLGAGMTTVFRDDGRDSRDVFSLDANASGVPWHGLMRTPEDYDTMRALGGASGWMILDEPSRLEMPYYATLADYAQQRTPDALIYTTSKANTNPTSLYGNSTQPGYTYSHYLTDLLDIVQPDVLMYDQYPFAPGTEQLNSYTPGGYFSEMMLVRSKAQAAGLPYWAWLQSYDEIRDPPAHSYRRPSESDMRMQLFTYLAAGFTGFNMWTYDGHPGRPYSGLIDFNGDPSPQYTYAASALDEAGKLGQSLRFLTSNDVRYLPGWHVVSNAILTRNTTPDGLSDWSSGAGGDPHLVHVEVDQSQAGRIGEQKNGLIGLFTDDGGEHYFMLTNLNHGEDLSANETALSFELTFDSSVESIWRLDRETGLAEEVILTDHTLVWRLPGGTGDLFKYDNTNFAGLIPEPAAGFALLGGLWFIAGGRLSHRLSQKENAS